VSPGLRTSNQYLKHFLVTPEDTQTMAKEF
jgi:hypothetical protein